ncbi:hypothetical protein EYC80_009625 [Monilinia laxa]|uniref:Uncharacterized protein n=1 Tax=Monilinia laxa TaxID=61186 RepID=A0A5N6JYH1_MONLA|nr:hypothetical protein EYC80_009625 [Monilinia laxa]
MKYSTHTTTIRIAARLDLNIPYNRHINHRLPANFKKTNIHKINRMRRFFTTATQAASHADMQICKKQAILSEPPQFQTLLKENQVSRALCSSLKPSRLHSLCIYPCKHTIKRKIILIPTRSRTQYGFTPKTPAPIREIKGYTLCHPVYVRRTSNRQTLVCQS